MSTSSSPEQPIAGSGTIVRRWPPSALAIAALCGITLAFYHRLCLPDQVLIKGDAFRLFPPIKRYMSERLSSGELPQWFPYEGMGRPFIGVTATGVFDPFTALYFLFSVGDAYRASVLLSCLLAALGAFALGRTLNFSRSASLLSGMAFALSGYVVSLTYNPQYLYAICVLPLFCAALEKALLKSRAWVAAPAVLWATVFLHGDVQTGYYYGFIALLWAGARAPGPYREAALRLAFVGGLAALLSGIQLAPALAVFLGSARAQQSLFSDQAMLLSTPPLRLLTMLVSPVGEEIDPNVLGRVFFGNPEGMGWAESLYLGGPVMGLALLGAWHRRDLHVLVWLGSFALLLSLGQFGGLYKLFYHVVPLWSVFRFPEKLMGVTSFAGALLAGAGVDALRSGTRRARPWLAGAIICLGAAFALSTDGASLGAAAHFGTPAALAAEVTRSAAQAFLFSALAAAGLGFIVMGMQRRTIRVEILLVILVVMVTLDLSRVNLGMYQTGPAETATFVPPFAQALQAREGQLAPGRFRLISIDEPIVVLPKDLMRSLGYYGAKSVERRQALDREHNAEFQLEMLQPYLPGFNTELLVTIHSMKGPEASARLNVKYYIGRRYRVEDTQLATTLVAELPEYDLALFRNPASAKPRAYLSLNPEPVVTPVDPATLYARPDFLSGEVDVVETTDVTLPGPSQGNTVNIERYAPEEVRIRVETPQPTVLILLDAFEKGWAATLESGLELPILRANALVRAVIVPAGTHTITFRYETPLLRIGALASLAGCLICVGFVVRERWRKHPNRLS